MNSELKKRQDALNNNIWRQVFENENTMFSNIKNGAYQSENNARIRFCPKEVSGEEYDVKILEFIPKTAKNYVKLTGYHTIEYGFSQYQKYALKYKNAQITFDFSKSPGNYRIIYSIVDGENENVLAEVSENGEGRFPICTTSELNDAKKRLAEGEFPTIWNIISRSLKNHIYAPSIMGDFRQIKSLSKSTTITPLTEEQKQIMALSSEVERLREVIRSLTKNNISNRIGGINKLPDDSTDGYTGR